MNFLLIFSPLPVLSFWTQPELKVVLGYVENLKALKLIKSKQYLNLTALSWPTIELNEWLYCLPNFGFLATFF
jgi:hypothetical protein